jgi:hypothetical protein
MSSHVEILILTQDSPPAQSGAPPSVILALLLMMSFRKTATQSSKLGKHSKNWRQIHLGLALFFAWFGNLPSFYVPWYYKNLGVRNCTRIWFDPLDVEY